jgi:hypothetical protein
MLNYSAILNFQEQILSMKILFLPKVNKKKLKNNHFWKIFKKIKIFRRHLQSLLWVLAARDNLFTISKNHIQRFCYQKFCHIEFKGHFEFLKKHFFIKDEQLVKFKKVFKKINKLTRFKRLKRFDIHLEFGRHIEISCLAFFFP